MKRRRQRIDSTARARRRAVHGGTRREVEDDQGDGPKEVAARASGGGRRPGRWAKQADSTEWAGLAAGLAKGFGPNSRI
jgi:hypothetical protein